MTPLLTSNLLMLLMVLRVCQRILVVVFAILLWTLVRFMLQLPNAFRFPMPRW